MAELRIEKPTLVTQVEGAVFVMDADGTLRRATPGMQLEPGMRLLTESDGRFELADPAGEAPDASQPEQGGVGPAGAMNPELATLQEAIRQGADPTELFEETAAGDAAAGTAGGVVGSSAGGFVVVDRINDATLAEAGFDTDHQGALPGEELLYSEDQDLLAAITITEPQTADNIINGDEATGVIIRGVVEDVEVGQTVTVTLIDQEGNLLTTTTVVLPGFVWEANFGDVTGKLVARSVSRPIPRMRPATGPATPARPCSTPSPPLPSISATRATPAPVRWTISPATPSRCCRARGSPAPPSP